jgi:hypothetical protein
VAECGRHLTPVKPVSAQNKNKDKIRFKREIKRITANSEYIVTNTCWIAIDYYCQHINRLENPGVYDIDNIVKPILDALVGQKGLIVDDVLVDRVTVNWIDTPHEDYFEVYLEYPLLNYVKKSDLVFVKSNGGWCFPAILPISQAESELIQHEFSLWNSIRTEDDYYEVLPFLPIQGFIYFSKIKDKGYKFIDLSNL